MAITITATWTSTFEWSRSMLWLTEATSAQQASLTGPAPLAARLLPSTLIAVGVLAVVASADRAAAAEDGGHLVAICAACHRLDGRSTGIPSILRWEAEEIVDKMLDFRASERASPIMRAVSLSLSDDEIAAVAAEIAAIGRRAKSP
ncbi:c-type cytochrome [Methylobacterium planeticum]|uniref:Cytochrome c domain-containing protein n=1 Tax=Methylobacterium planeticum TaxID=2615211 RepID=A0A6N6MRC6_9HYPH|nr:hypothetical protein [Methylobacterium planeticum]KAB1072982.1 hypothetical protein F6X51_13440 [Methylobacterium planeticum]